MWKCVKCGEEQSDDKHKFCWKCGYRNINAVMTRKESIESSRRGVPQFGSLEELAPEPPKYKESLGEKLGGGILEILFTVIGTVVVVPILRYAFGRYGTYISILLVVIVVIFTLWRVFHRDPSEGRGLDLGS